MLRSFNKTSSTDAEVRPLFGSRVMDSPIPRFELPEEGIAPEAAAQLIHDELSLDGNPLLNLASFVTTWMDREAGDLMSETLSKNFIDQEQYPITSDIERRCVGIIAGLFHSPAAGAEAIGTSTVGSSEAIHLGGLAMKWRWRKRREQEGKDATRPNLVMSSAVHVTWEKFCRYFDVEPREQPLVPGRYVIDPEAAMDSVDENTIGVVGVLGTTYTGAFEPIEELDKALSAVNEKNGWEVPIHVDAASGGFVAPFVYPDLKWDFRLDNVHSINVSGHKYGLVYPGIGWAIWRDSDSLPQDLVFSDNYLGAVQETFDLNFSRAANTIVGQYYNLIRLGRKGYRQIMGNLLDTTKYLADAIVAGGRMDLISSLGGLPLVCARPAPEFSEIAGAHDLVAALRERGWIVPAYNMPPAIEDMSVIRVVIREGFSRDLAERLVEDINGVVSELKARPPARPRPPRKSKLRPC